MRNDSRTERAARRRFALLVMLHRRACRYDEILAMLKREKLLDDDGPASAALVRQQRYQFRHDLAALREMGCDIAFERKSRCYAWRNSPFGLNLDRSQLSTFALLCDTFERAIILHADKIHDLLAYFIGLLSKEQQQELSRLRRSFSIDLHETTDYRSADPTTVADIEKAIERGQQLEFSYKTPRDGKERRHVIEPRPLVFERGHVYLYGWSLDWTKDLRFRLDYILPGTARVLHTTIARDRLSRPAYTLRYRLSAVIARNSVSEHFPGQVVEPHPDGSATVTAQVTDLFDARRILLSYGMHCMVLEPPELVAEMCEIADELFRIYHTLGE